MLGDFGISYLVPATAVYCIWQRRWNYFLYLGALIVTSYIIRAAGRTTSTSYQTFLQILARAQKSFNTENAELLRRYDFEFKSWPASFRSTTISGMNRQTSFRDVRVAESSTICWAIGWVVAHTFGIRLIYPGLLFSRLLKSTLDVMSKISNNLFQNRNINISNFNRKEEQSLLWSKMEFDLKWKLQTGTGLIQCSLTDAGKAFFIHIEW